MYHRQVAWVQTAADLLLPRYAGSWRVRLESACDALSAAWSEGNLRLADRHRRLVDSADRSNWLTRQRHLLVWLRVYLAQVNSRRPLTNVAHLACLEEAAELEADQQRRRREERERRHARHRGRRGLDTGQRAMYGRSRKRSQSRQKSPSHKTQQQKQQQQQQQQSQRGRKIWDQRLPQLDKSLFTCRLTLPDADASSTKPASDHPSNTLCQPDLRLWNKPNGAVSRFSRQPSLHETGGRWAGL
ncbi:unnamed protein product [Protopolystoma xenopodis]|uniref:Uncharacterized protein n=1 Tax=Protopolystoma xenopodis TaxID=117903 RepID=A0A448XCK7_9PLAT|nr:unnamed protein product [Protopolystoma xenopodis]